MGKAELFARAGEDHSVLTRVASRSDGMDANLLGRPAARTFMIIFRTICNSPAAGIGDDPRHRQGGSGRRIRFVPVVGLDDLDVVTLEGAHE